MHLSFLWCAYSIVCRKNGTFFNVCSFHALTYSMYVRMYATLLSWPIKNHIETKFDLLPPSFSHNNLFVLIRIWAPKMRPRERTLYAYVRMYIIIAIFLTDRSSCSQLKFHSILRPHIAVYT